MSDLNKADEKRLLWDDSTVVHACESCPVDSLPRLIWTKCRKDVPANAAFRGTEAVTCKECVS